MRTYFWVFGPGLYFWLAPTQRMALPVSMRTLEKVWSSPALTTGDSERLIWVKSTSTLTSRPDGQLRSV